MNATSSDEAVTLELLLDRLDGLTDLFKRRLLDDRAKQSAIDDLQSRLDRSEKAASAAALKPLVDSLSLVIERLHGVEPSESLIVSIVSELEYVLEAVVGVTTILAEPGMPVDRARHEVASVSGEGPGLQVAEPIRVGYEKDGVVLRPAVIAARRVTADSEGEPGDNE